jgi:DNA polymerase V
MKVKQMRASDKIDLFIPEVSGELYLVLVDAGISAGFPSPAEDYLDLKLDLNRELIKNPSSTFFGRVNGDSMIDAGIHDGDILVIDKSLNPKENSILVCCIDGEFTVKKITKKGNNLYLLPQNPAFRPIKISPESDFRLWGVVTYSIHNHF